MLVLISVLGMGAVWALFLSLQHNGWSAFFEFARNRASSEADSFGGRLWWYLRLFTRQYYLFPISALIGLAAIVALRERGAVVLLGGGYFAAAMLALGRHEYLLDRNLFAPALALIVVASVGVGLAVERVRRFGWAAWARASLALALVAVLVAGGLRARAQAERYLPPGDGALARLSDFVASAMDEGVSTRVVGTFDWLSAGWVQILGRQRTDDRSRRVACDFPYPGPESRMGYVEPPESDCARAVDDWLGSAPEEIVVTIEIDDSSTCFDRGYRLWSSWKRPYGRLIAERLAGRVMSELDLPEAGIHARVHHVAPEPLLFGGGWGPAEPWGRWAMERSAWVRAPAGSSLEIEYGAFPGMREPQRVRVTCAGAVVDEFVVEGEPWAWQRRTFPVPGQPGQERSTVTFEFAGRFHGDPADALWRSLPVRRLSLAGATASLPAASARP